ncbi:hypothetical protein VTP01DRAFT_8945 [Rhizomucor pusillus]|uniref:uncharacterized protein n=1 Tax=Rhizomucor pusillus TaxID=4840 RepID=UPI003743545D
MVRIKNRWILFELIENPVFENGEVVFPRTTLGLTEEDIGRAIAAAINADFGDYGLGMAKSLNVKWYNPMTRVGIARIPREYTDMVLATLFFMNKIGKQTCSFRILHVSGTIIKVQNQAIIRDRDIYLEERAKAEKRGQSYTVQDKIEKSAREIKQIQAFS